MTTDFPTFDQFLAGLSRAACVPPAPRRPSGMVKPSALPADFLVWLDAEVEVMYRAGTLKDERSREQGGLVLHMPTRSSTS